MNANDAPPNLTDQTQGCVPRELTQERLDRRAAASALIKPADLYTLADRVEETARRQGERPFLLYGGQRFSYAEVDARVAGALSQVGMGRFKDRLPAHLSFGQRRRVALAGVLATDPDVLVLDEPSSNLDPAARDDLARVLGGLDVAVLMVTHDLPYAAQLCSRCLVMDEGRVVADGSTREILGDEELLAAHRLALPYGFQLPKEV